MTGNQISRSENMFAREGRADSSWHPTVKKREFYGLILELYIFEMTKIVRIIQTLSS